MGIILDATFLIDLEREDPDAVRTLETLVSLPEELLIPSVVLAQYLMSITDKEGTLADLAKWARIIHLGEAEALAAAELAWTRHRKGTWPGWSDVLIAGYAKALGNIPVVTRNLKGFAECETITY